ncbi:hypothetical protein JCM19241_5215 [Vibrio ishigakensis]|uniref:Uncharacterized protein n=1 Tax=Vibrio ishigakensis TaxID=1481914 RepID=A0A0B8QHC5_9VIBR|nr:hypothetical protein JCM19241_5215 [Vibrio ishigakensis]
MCDYASVEIYLQKSPIEERVNDYCNDLYAKGEKVSVRMT